MTLKKIFLMVMLLAARGIWADAPIDKTSKIAIIGAGASGLTAAFHLQQLGYENITVFEKENRVGGKVYSYPYKNFIYELGAFWVTEGSNTIFEMAEHYGLVPVTEEAEFIVLSSDNDTYSFEDNLFKNYSLLEISWALLNFERTRAKFRKDLNKIGYDNIHPDLYMPFEEFIKKYNLEPLAYAFRPFWIGCGYGYYETTPALYVMKLMVPGIVDTLTGMLKRLNPFQKAEKNSGLLRFDEGYMELFDTVARDLPDVRLGAEVTSVKRLVIDSKPLIKITANGQTEEFDQVIISADLRAALKFLDASMEEQMLFSQVDSYRLKVKLVETEGINYPLNSMIWYDAHGTIDTQGRLTSLVNRAEIPDVWFTSQLLPWNSPTSNTEKWLLEDLSSAGGTITNTVVEKDWNYFPYVGEEALKGGFYEKLKSLQGQRGTYFIGGVLNFETVEYTAAFAKDLVHKNF